VEVNVTGIAVDSLKVFREPDGNRAINLYFACKGKKTLKGEMPEGGRVGSR